MLLAVHYRVMEHVGSLKSTKEALELPEAIAKKLAKKLAIAKKLELPSAITSGNSYASFVLSKLPTCSITR